MRVRGLGVPVLVLTPRRTQTVHLPIGFFRPRFLLQINLGSFLQEWLAFPAREEGVAGFLCLCSAEAASPRPCRPGMLWSGPDRGLGEAEAVGLEESMMPGPQPGRLLPAGPVPRTSRAMAIRDTVFRFGWDPTPALPLLGHVLQILSQFLYMYMLEIKK